MNIMLTDIVFAIGTLCFLSAMIPAVRKLILVEYSDAQSLVHNEITMIGHILMLLLAFLILAPISIVINLISIGFRVWLILLVRKKRSHKLKYKSDIVYYLAKLLKKN